MSESFEQFTLKFLRGISRGGQIKYNDSLKSFTIHRNNWFVRTIPLFLLMEAWEARQ